MPPELIEKRERLATLLREATPVVIAYSGGVDSPSLPRQALADALSLARAIGAPVEVVKTSELENPDYASNPVNRCYFCKAELFTKMDALAAERGYRAIAYGENADDMRQTRPGRLAATEFSILAPLRDAGL